MDFRFAENNMARAKQMGDTYRTALDKLTQDGYAKQSATFLDRMITDPKVVARYAKESVKSDPKAVGQAMFELLTTDLRGDMEKIQSPVLVLAAAQFATDLEAQNQLLGTYESQVSKIPHHSVVLALKARHFIFLDSPEFFFQTVDKFLSSAAG
jgi:N-formylmaleamate deformylase